MSSPLRSRLLSITAKERTVTIEGDTILIRALSLGDRTALVAKCSDDAGEVQSIKLVPAVLVATCLDPETREPIFTAGDLDAINGLPASAVDPLWKAAAELNGLAAATEETAAKNSAALPS